MNDTPAPQEPSPPPEPSSPPQASPQPQSSPRSSAEPPLAPARSTAEDTDGEADDGSAHTAPGDVTRSLLRHASDMAAEVGAAALFVYSDALPGNEWLDEPNLHRRLVLVTRSKKERENLEARGYKVVHVPGVRLTRMGQVKMAVLLALSRDLLQPGDTIVCLAGMANSGTLDMLLVTEVGKEYEVFLAPSGGEAKAPYLHPEVLSRSLELAVELGSEGREGKPVGTLFVVGDTQKVIPLTHQMILNPFFGYGEKDRNLLDYRLRETVKELATVDGAFIIRGDGVIESAGTYLKTSRFPEESLPSGLGARHQAAAGITYVTESIAIAVSESTGTVSVFRHGKVVTELEKPRTRIRARGE